MDTLTNLLSKTACRVELSLNLVLTMKKMLNFWWRFLPQPSALADAAVNVSLSCSLSLPLRTPLHAQQAWSACPDTVSRKISKPPRVLDGLDRISRQPLNVPSNSAFYDSKMPEELRSIQINDVPCQHTLTRQLHCFLQSCVMALN